MLLLIVTWMGNTIGEKECVYFNIQQMSKEVLVIVHRLGGRPETLESSILHGLICPEGIYQTLPEFMRVF